MGYINRNCDHCSKKYHADERNLKRGWGKSCSKSCAASLREKQKPSYDSEIVKRNNRIREGKMTVEDFKSLPMDRQIYLNQKRFGAFAPNVVGGSGRLTGITSEGYRIMDGVAYDKWDNPVYNTDGTEDDYDQGWDSHK